jgi:hypothetical protein
MHRWQPPPPLRKGDTIVLLGVAAFIILFAIVGHWLSH